MPLEMGQSGVVTVGLSGGNTLKDGNIPNSGKHNMKLEKLYPDFAGMSDKEQLAFIRNYRHKRFMDLQTYNVEAPKKKTIKRKIVKKKALPPMEQESLDILKKLGITAGQISKVRK